MLQQCPWFHSDIKVHSKVIFHKNLYRKGIVELKQFYHKEQQLWLTVQEFKQKYDLKINYLDYWSIVQNIPKEWVRLFKIKRDNQLSINTQLSNRNKIMRCVYQIMVQEIKIKDTARYRWECKLQMEITDQTWDNHVSDVFKITNYTKLRWFQFRMFNHILTTNQIRAKYEEISPLCYYCNQEIETVIHLFCKCEKVKNIIWKPLKKWLYYFCFLDFNHEEQDIIILLNYKDCYQK